MATAGSLVDRTVHDAQAMRSAGAELLSLALLDARNRTLAWLGVLDGVSGAQAVVAGFDPPAWIAGHAGWFQERWIARHLRRGQGAQGDASAPPLPSIEPRADAWFDPARSGRRARWSRPVPDAAVRDYLGATLDATLDLLARAGDGDDGLYMFRLALAHEDRCGEALAALAQSTGLPPERQQAAAEAGLCPELPARARREPLWQPSQAWPAGEGDGAWAPEAERGPVPEVLPEFEIDAQPVCWAQFAEFSEDGGYDERRWWTEAGWQWLQAGAGRRAPRYVEQLAGGVLAQRLGRLRRLPAAQSVLHVSVHEAEAWCRWAGRRLPAEAEWELAACTAASRGFVWGDGLEWVLGRARALPGAEPAPPLLDVLPPDGEFGPPRVLRGGSAFGSARLRHPRARRYAAGEADAAFTAFRSCAL